jgi:hypothetical protein
VTCLDPAATGLGAYVLGALEPEERDRLERHVAGCPVCAAELAELRTLPPLLDRVRPEDLRPVPVTPSPDLYDRLSAAARRTGRHRRRAWGLVAAAVLVLGGAATGVAVWATGSDERTVAATEGPVDVLVTASQEGGGVELYVAVTGMRPGEWCSVVAVGEDGSWHEAGGWPVSPDGDGTWETSADVPLSDLAEVAVLGDGGRELARLRF